MSSAGLSLARSAAGIQPLLASQWTSFCPLSCARPAVITTITLCVKWKMEVQLRTVSPCSSQRWMEGEVQSDAPWHTVLWAGVTGPTSPERHRQSEWCNSIYRPHVVDLQPQQSVAFVMLQQLDLLMSEKSSEWPGETDKLWPCRRDPLSFTQLIIKTKSKWKQPDWFLHVESKLLPSSHCGQKN